MAHAIIFTDRAPQTRNFDRVQWHSSYFNYPAGAYKLASVLRQHGLKVIVVPNCLHLSAAGVRQIIHNNSRDLVWVGISTTLLPMRSGQFDQYRDLWRDSTESIIGIDSLFGTTRALGGSTELPWSTPELNYLGDWLHHEHDVPLLIGGAWITHIKNGNLGQLNNNCYLVTGYAEQYIEDFTLAKIKDPTVRPSVICTNGDYDDGAFKNSKIMWQPEDFVDPDSVLPLEVARGCAFNCSYCTYDRKSTFDSYKDAEALRQELIRNYELYGVTKYMLVDDLYNDSKQKVRYLYDQVWSRLPFQPEWSSYMRLDMLYADRESAQYIKASGAKLGSFGIETLHDRAGRSVGKGLGKKRILETLEYLREVWHKDVLISAYFLAGLPYEPRESIQETMHWSMTTDLLFSASWNPLWLTPPSHMDIVNPTTVNDIAKHTDKWNVQWVEPGIWLNSMGLRFDEVDRMCSDTMRRLPHGMKIAFADYADLRTAGLSHQDIAGLYQNPDAEKLLMAGSQKVNDRIDLRLQKVLQITD